MKHKPITKARRERLIALRGDRCFNCGTPDDIEWHHVVPLEVGGNDVDTNMVPLCYSCHKAVTHHELLLSTSGRPHKSGGRKRIIPDNYKEILHDYLYGKISKTECTARLGLSQKNKGWLRDSVWYKEYLDELGIKSCKNNVEIKAANGLLQPGVEVGYVKYIDGRVETILYNPEGQHDAKVAELLEKSNAIRQEKERKRKLIVDEIKREIRNSHPMNDGRREWEEYKKQHYSILGEYYAPQNPDKISDLA